MLDSPNLKFSKNWKEQIKTLVSDDDLQAWTNFAPWINYHSPQLVDFVLELDWNFLRREYTEERLAFSKAVVNTLVLKSKFPASLAEFIAGYASPLWEGSWYTSGELFLRFFSERQFVGVFGVLYVLIGCVDKDDYKIRFHQYPIEQNEFTDVRVTLFGSLECSNRRIESQFVHGLMDANSCIRGPTLVRDAGPRIILNFAAKNDIAGLQKCIRNGMDVNMTSEEVQSSTALMMAAVSGHVGAVKFLLENRANPLLERPNGITALTYAQQRNYTEICKLLSAEINENYSSSDFDEDSDRSSNEIMSSHEI